MDVDVTKRGQQLQDDMQRAEVLRLNNVMGNIINNYGSLSRLDTMRLAELLLERGVRPPLNV